MLGAVLIAASLFAAHYVYRKLVAHWRRSLERK